MGYTTLQHITTKLEELDEITRRLRFLLDDIELHMEGDYIEEGDDPEGVLLRLESKE